MGASEGRHDKPDVHAELCQDIGVSVFFHKIIAGRFVIHEVRRREFPDREGQVSTGIAAGYTGYPCGVLFLFKGIDKLAEAFFPESGHNKIDAWPVENLGIAGCMLAAHNNDRMIGSPDFFGQLNDPVGFAGYRSKPHDMRFEPVIFSPQAVGVHLEVDDGDFVAVQIAGDRLQTQRFPPENLLHGGNAIFLFRDAPARIGRIDQQDTHR